MVKSGSINGEVVRYPNNVSDCSIWKTTSGNLSGFYFSFEEIDDIIKVLTQLKLENQLTYGDLEYPQGDF
jgi:hypothetical protein